MGVATFVQTNYTGQDSATYKAAIDADLQVLAVIGQDFAPHQSSPAAMTITIDAGSMFVAGAIVSKAAQTSGAIAAPSSHPRIDRAVIDQATAVLSIITGAENASPSPPAITAGKLPIAQILLTVGQSSIVNANITDERSGSGSTPIITQSMIGAGAVGQAQLKTSSGSVNNNTNAANLTLPGGAYGFYPQIKMGSTGSYVWLAEISSPSFAFAGWTAAYVTNICLGTTYSAVIYAQQTYVTASGEVHWIFILRDKKTKGIFSVYQAPDHPCFGNGGKPNLVPHPFPGFDSATQEIIVVNPDADQIVEIMALCIVDDENEPDLDPIEVILKHYDIDETTEAKWPEIPVTVGLPKGKDWKRMPEGSTVISVKKVIPKPNEVIARMLVRKKA